MEFVITLKHGRLALTAEQTQRIGNALVSFGQAEIRLAGRCIIIADTEPVELLAPAKKKRRKRAKRR